MNLSEKNNHFKKLLQLKVGVCPVSELESDNRNFPELELESDDETSDSTALVAGAIYTRLHRLLVLK